MTKRMNSSRPADAGIGFERLCLSSSEAVLILSMSSDVVAAFDEAIISDSAKIAAMGCGRSSSSRKALWNASTIENGSGIVVGGGLSVR